MPKLHRKVLHTSDIHLDDWVPPDGQESPAQLGLINVIDASFHHEVDLLLIAGDLFDHNRVGEQSIQFARQQLARANCPVVIITGNHDCFTDQCVYHRFDLAEIGPHIHLLTEEEGETLDLHDLQVRIWGRGIVDHHPENYPLEQVPDRQGDYWHVGITHGYYTGRGAAMYSSLITAPEIAAADLDYLALGHVHAFSVVSHGDPCAAYSGSPTCHPHIPGGTAALATLDPDTGVRVEPVRVDESADKQQNLK
ncbi:MAG: metallophosphoesterase [Pseudomonadales bacterium]|jgi:DNA repair exonuclease SbcCD nuclease subunit|nr:metallophosphoesterase [Pseudomonadales bacterium]MDP7593990.1 metallophosphoesterase [Pseudomonadales bacterium]HJN48854.1 metallophosphoesterase [Pseudomonadales bacterium]